MRGCAGGSEEGTGGFAGDFAVAGGLVEGAAVVGEGGDGDLAGLGRAVGGAEVGEFVGFGDDLADGGLFAPGGELGEGELVVAGDDGELEVGVQEIGEELFDVDGFVIDLGVDGVGGGEHESNVAGMAGDTRDPNGKWRAPVT